MKLSEIGIHRVQIPLPFSGLESINCYIAQGEEGWTIIDAGIGNVRTKKYGKKHFQN